MIRKMKYLKLPAVKLLLMITTFSLLLYISDLITFNNYWLILAFTGIIIVLSLLSRKYFAAYILSSFFISIILFIRISNLVLPETNKIMQDTPAIIKGQVEKILIETDRYSRVIFRGMVDTKYLPKIQSQGVVLTIFKYKPTDRIDCGSEIFANLHLELPNNGNLETDFPMADYCRGIGVSWCGVVRYRNISILSAPGIIKSTRNSILSDIDNKIQFLFGKSSGNIVYALATGDKSRIDRDTKQNFSVTGTAHVLAISGLHIGIIAFLINFILLPIKSRLTKILLFSIIVMLFIFLTGFQPSGIRAGLLSCLIYYVYTFNHRINIINILAFVVIVTILWQPKLIFSAGFRMSVFAVAGIVLFYPVILEKLKMIFKSGDFIADYLWRSIALTISVTITVAPLTAYYFGIFSFSQIIANLIVVPCMILGMIYSYLGIALSFVIPFASEIFANTADLCFSVSLYITDLLASIPFSHYSGKSAFVLSLIISIVILYLINSIRQKQVFFRLMVSAFILFSGITITDKYYERNNDLIISARKHLSSVIINNSNTLYIIAADRKPALYPKRDIAFEQYLKEQNNKEIKIFANGNNGYNLYDYICDDTDAELIDLTLYEQDRICGELGIRRLEQIIEIENEN